MLSKRNGAKLRESFCPAVELCSKIFFLFICQILKIIHRLDVVKIKHHRRHYVCTFGGSRPWLGHLPQYDNDEFPKRIFVLGKTWVWKHIHSPLHYYYTCLALLFSRFQYLAQQLFFSKLKTDYI